jgi:DeoR/GlpR family transcriptional regulator of sugar metabolism
VAAEFRIDMALVDKQVLAAITRRDEKRVRFIDLASEVGCSPMTIRRAVHRLKAAGHLEWEYTAGGVMRFTVVPEKDNGR